jgi:hypothetical protein
MHLLPPDGRSVFQLEIYVSSIHPIVVTGFRSQENTSLVGGGRVSRTAMDCLLLRNWRYYFIIYLMWLYLYIFIAQFMRTIEGALTI